MPSPSPKPDAVCVCAQDKMKIGSDEKTTHVEYVIVDCCAIKILDLTAISALAEVRFITQTRSRLLSSSHERSTY